MSGLSPWTDRMAKKPTKRKRKPLTKAEKEQRARLLEKARANKAPSKHVTVHPDVPRDDDHPLGLKKVRKWIKTNKEEVSSLRAQLKREPNDKKVRARYNELDCYVQNLQSYLRSGTYLDFRYGENMEGRIKRVCRVPAYHWHEKDPYFGLIRREVGVIYPDVGLWTQEMHEDYYDKAPVEKKPAPKKRRRRKKPK